MKKIKLGKITKFRNDNSASYYVGKYYFTVKTYSFKRDSEFEENDKRYILELVEKFQDNIVHEYIHYIHEVSTLIGSFCLSISASLRSIFSFSLDQDKNSSKALGYQKSIPKYHTILHKKYEETLETLNGDAIIFNNNSVTKISEISYIKKYLNVEDEEQIVSQEIEIPELKLVVYDNKKFTSDVKVKIGRFFIYEGIAYELDRVYNRIRRNANKIEDYAKGTEYTLLRNLAQHICPKIKTKEFLTFAVLSLNTTACGKTFMEYLEKLKGKNQQEIEENIRAFKSDMSHDLFTKLEDFKEMQNQLKDSYLGRPYLDKAIEFIVEQNIKLYELRIKNPCFEIDNIYSGNLTQLRNDVSICDYMFTFKDRDEYLRDYFGSVLPVDNEVSLSLKVLATHDHYFMSHNRYSTSEIENATKNNKYRCPIYTSCSHHIRQTSPQICNKRPWRSYEMEAVERLCVYGAGVLAFKAVEQP